MEEKTSKKSYYLPNKLTEAFAEWCKPGRDYSPKIAGLILAGIALDNPTLLSQLTKLAHSNDIKKATTKAKQLISETLLDSEIQKHIDELGPAKEEFLRLLMQAKEKASQRK